MGCILSNEQIFIFRRLNIFVIFEAIASFIITDIYKLIFYLFKKCIFNDLELELKVIWHCVYLFILSPQKVSPYCLKTYLMTQNLISNIFKFNFKHPVFFSSL